MVKRNTDYKQLFLVDSFYLKHFDQQNQSLQNKISNNHSISLSTPKTQQYFNNHYSIPPTNLIKYSYDNFANTIHLPNNQNQNNDISKESNHNNNGNNKCIICNNYQCSCYNMKCNKCKLNICTFKLIFKSYKGLKTTTKIMIISNKVGTSLITL